MMIMSVTKFVQWNTIRFVDQMGSLTVMSVHLKMPIVSLKMEFMLSISANVMSYVQMILLILIVQVLISL